MEKIIESWEDLRRTLLEDNNNDLEIEFDEDDCRATVCFPKSENHQKISVSPSGLADEWICLSSCIGYISNEKLKEAMQSFENEMMNVRFNPHIKFEYIFLKDEKNRIDIDNAQISLIEKVGTFSLSEFYEFIESIVGIVSIIKNKFAENE